MGPATLAQISREREAFLALLVVPTCSECRDTATAPSVAYGGSWYCSRHAVEHLGDMPASVYREAWC